MTLSIDTVLEVFGGLLLGLAFARGLHLARIIRTGPRSSVCAWCGGNETRTDDPQARQKMRTHLVACEEAPYTGHLVAEGGNRDG